jgi:hypothetical protein
MTEHGKQSRQVTERNGGASRDRTDDLIVANDALSQLSYSPTRSGRMVVAGSFYQRLLIDTKPEQEVCTRLQTKFGEKTLDESRR